MTFENEFGLFERLLHRFAFHSGFSQVMLADLEDRIFVDDLAGVTVDRPVFISGLPRSGTTILLQILNATGRFASHTYQDMPFLLCPLLWSRFAGRFTIDRAPRERAHGDGLEISTRSPEAFEELIWKRFWPDHYRDDRIQPWSATDQDSEFDEFFERHMTKIIAVRERDRLNSAPLRYLSKNNVSISRLGGFSSPLDRGIFVIPYRDPFQHAASMLVQHRRFSVLHREDPFARKYMEGIGHHDFGLTFRPINFGGWLEHASEPDGIEFWVRYWNAAYRHVLSHLMSSIHLISYSGLTSEPRVALNNLALVVDVSPEDLLARIDDLSVPRTHEVPLKEISGTVRSEALDILADLEEAYRRQA